MNNAVAKVKIKEFISGEPETYATGVAHDIICCDCGLVHTVVFRVVDKETVEVRYFRNEYFTRKERRERRVYAYKLRKRKEPRKII